MREVGRRTSPWQLRRAWTLIMILPGTLLCKFQETSHKKFICLKYFKARKNVQLIVRKVGEWETSGKLSCRHGLSRLEGTTRPLTSPVQFWRIIFSQQSPGHRVPKSGGDMLSSALVLEQLDPGNILLAGGGWPQPLLSSPYRVSHGVRVEQHSGDLSSSGSVHDITVGPHTSEWSCCRTVGMKYNVGLCLTWALFRRNCW